MVCGLAFSLLFLSILSCGMPPPGTTESGYTVYGHVVKTLGVDAPQIDVTLLDGNTKQPLDVSTTNWMGQYSFSGLPSGYYIVQAGDKHLPVVIKDKNMEVGINLSAANGKMDHTSHVMTQMLKGFQAGFQTGHSANPTAAKGPPGSPDLVRHFSGMWASYTGTSGGGTLKNFYLYPNGVVTEHSETSYQTQYSSDGWSETGSGQFSATGTNSDQAQWRIFGNKEQGQIVIIFPDGSQESHNYRVHVEKGQVYWNEYWFGGRHYSKQKSF
jgi:hypothetical protein